MRTTSKDSTLVRGHTSMEVFSILGKLMVSHSWLISISSYVNIIWVIRVPGKCPPVHHICHLRDEIWSEPERGTGSQSEARYKCHRPMRSKWESSLTGALPSQGAAGESCHRESALMSHRPIKGCYCPQMTNERQGSADVTELMTMSPSQFITDVTTNQQPLSSAIVNGEFGKFVHHQCSPDLSDCIFLLHNISHWTRETDAIIVIPHIAQSHPDSEPFTRDCRRKAFKPQ